MPEIGSYSLLLALALSAYTFAAGIIAIVRSNDRLAETARRAGIALFFSVTAAAVALAASAFRDDFSLAYILHHSNRDLPIPYKFAALWSGQEGSLLFWSWLLATYGLVLRLRHKVDTRLVAYASVIIAAVQIFFLLLVNFAAHPFAMVTGTIAPDGNGLNPLLQYPEMVIHPPMLYLGYVGMTVPFAFALAALIMKYPGEKWIHITRRWTMVGWAFLTCGIFLGAHWAYAVLGWGGYWGWDPSRTLPCSLAHRHRLPAFGDDAGEARHDEGLEHVADLRHLPAFHLRHLPHALRRGQLGSRLCPVGNRPLVRGFPGNHLCHLCLFFMFATVWTSEERAPTEDELRKNAKDGARPVRLCQRDQ